MHKIIIFFTLLFFFTNNVISSENCITGYACRINNDISNQVADKKISKTQLNKNKNIKEKKLHKEQNKKLKNKNK